MGPQAREIYIIQHLEEIIGTVVAQTKKIQVDEVNVLDPGDGTGLTSYAASFPQTVAAVLKALSETTGVDVTAILAGDKGRTPAAPSGATRPVSSPVTPRSAS
jgi:flotillin